jgi:hypothetical protein
VTASSGDNTDEKLLTGVRTAPSVGVPQPFRPRHVLIEALHCPRFPANIKAVVSLARDIKRIADECGTSTAMIHRHYLHELDVRHELPDDFSFDGAVEAARRGLRHLRVA